ncbi:protein aveugle [Folsomia candida]|uniref:protein aveugle n=1 Tax=Folsomia candida TaxID=158441 RepID=UPI000B8F9E5B|nr:protein aveugle [Folsomia candida]XP_021946375.1 protein aveugle [Folsomia candida]XP_035703650.1 protein aveugle [Folsomia candida]XP_035703651.1 protein aveugle [Folsomia candida]
MVILPGGGNHKDEGNSPVTPSTKSPIPGKPGLGTTRPRPPALWTVSECKLWLARHCGDLGVQYSELFMENNVNGRSLLRMNSAALERMGILDERHRQDIWREIIKLKLKSDILEIRDLESQVVSAK